MSDGRGILEMAQALAEDAHKGQVDKIDEPYIGHVSRVAAGVRDAGFGTEVQAVAWLHDVVEDTDVTLTDLIDAGFPPNVIGAVDTITKRPHEPFAAYYERVKANPTAMAVKWHDVADNAREDRLARVAPDTRERLRAKYERARLQLSHAVFAGQGKAEQ